MTSFVLQFDTSNTAYRSDSGNLEKYALKGTVMEMLERVSEIRIDTGDVLEVPVRDINGNTVGTLMIDESD